MIEPDYDSLSVKKQQSLTETVTLIVRKGAHFGEYLVLGALLWALVLTYTKQTARLVWCPWLAGTLYAVSDEFHQTFSGGRSPKLADVGIDSAGVLCGVLLCMAGWALYRKRKDGKGTEEKR